MVKSEYDRVWIKYCGFLDIDIEQFMSIQESLLLQQLSQITNCSLGRRLLGKRTPVSVEEFRHIVPTTTYKDYIPELNPGDETTLSEKPHLWANTTGSGGDTKRVPYTYEAYNRSLDNLMSVMILACSKQRGQSSITEGDRVLFNVAPAPYLSGILASGASQLFNLRPVMSPDMHDGMDFREKVTKGFEMSLRTGMDILMSMTSVLVKTGNEFSQMSKGGKISRHLGHPGEFMRLFRACLKSKFENRGILPKDIWPLKALIGWGIDTSLYRDLVHEYWGAYPYEFHACTEAGIMALQSWSRRGMTFLPHSNFYEFIPESEWEKTREDAFYEPRAVLLSDVKVGQRYEIVVTSFYRMPFIRYRLGHLIRIIALEEKETGIRLPQMLFEARADDLIDIAGFTRISEKTVTAAIVGSKIDCEDWTIRKEIREGKPTLHLYIEFNNGFQPEQLASTLHDELMKSDPGYHDLATMMEIRPLEVTLLPSGTFRDFYLQRQENGADLAQSRPPRMNAPDDIINELTGVKEEKPVAIS
ncbi:MAG TPA: GH3 auxin-responsive promoter family protein [Dehalococcoidia bacterium]|nr:GH3 auxin-responsive promoter family protein [Dehalococcoidia bacterium]